MNVLLGYTIPQVLLVLPFTVAFPRRYAEKKEEGEPDNPPEFIMDRWVEAIQAYLFVFFDVKPQLWEGGVARQYLLYVLTLLTTVRVCVAGH